MSNFMPIDFIFAGLILIFTVRCALRGFISELMSMAAIVLGMLASLCFFKKGGEFIQERFMEGHQTLSEILAFILLFVIVFLLIKILERILKDIVEGVKLGKADRFLGIIFGFIEGLIVVSLILFIISVQPLFDPLVVLHNSFFAGILVPLIMGISKSAAETALLFIHRVYGAAYV